MIKPIRKTIDATKGLSKDIQKPEGGHAVIITAELPPELERGGDIIRVDGMKLPDRVPLLAQHRHVQPDGSPSIIGKADNFRKTEVNYDGHKCSAIAADIYFADTELSQKYKSLWPEYIKDVSVGVMVKDGTPLDAKDPWGGWDYTKTELYELSVVTVPANPAASVIRAIKETFGEDFIPEDFESDGDEIYSAIFELLDNINGAQKQNNELLTKLTSRLDDIESTIVANAKGAESLRNPQSPQTDESKTLSRILEALNKRVGK